MTTEPASAPPPDETSRDETSPDETAPDETPAAESPPLPTLALLAERDAEERRVALVPEDVERLTKCFRVQVERGAGAEAGCPDAAYEAAGAELVERASKPDVYLKITPPSAEEIEALPEGSSYISLLYPSRDEARIEALAKRGVHAFALDRIPRTTVAQAMDVLSSMANIAGYRAVLEAASVYQGFFGAQVTAAGTAPPSRVLIIGAGVAGLAALGAARALGAEVRAFDVRPETREQIESLGGTFLTVDLEETGEGGGGYAKTMSKEFIEAEMALFRQQAREVDVIITTALVAGGKAPLLVPDDVVAELRPGSVVVDLAAEQGGNCSKTVPGEKIVESGVSILGYTDLPSRMATTASRFFSGNVRRYLEHLEKTEARSTTRADLDKDEIVRATLVTCEGEVIPPPPRKAPPAPPAPPAEPKRSAPAPQRSETAPPSPVSTLAGAFLASALVVLAGHFAPEAFARHFTVFVLSCFVGWQVVWAVAPALHTPLMSVTNAISGIVIVGGILLAGGGWPEFGPGTATILGIAAIVVASINVFGGFLVTQRMLNMFRKG